MIIAVTGPDGSGKSTLCSLAAAKINEKLGEKKACKVSVWDALSQANLFKSKQEVELYLSTLTNHSRMFFIFHALARAIDMAQEHKPSILLVEGYWYKYAVTEIAYGLKESDVLAAAQCFHQPHSTFFLEISPELAWQRKNQTASLYEQGSSLHKGAEKERFLKFQGKLDPIWKTLESRMSPWQHLSGERSTETLADTLVQECLGLWE